MDPRPALIIDRIGASASTFLPLFIYVVACSFFMGLGTYPYQTLVELLGAYVLPVLCIVLDGAANRATYGMRRTHLCIQSIDATPIRFWHCAARILLGILLLPFFPISAVLAYHDPLRRTLADRICNTTVWLDLKPTDPPLRRGFEIMPLEERQHL